MKIVFIGAGNLATNLALEISQSEHQIVQVFSRTWESASLLAEKVNCEPVNEMSKVVCDADLYIVSVKDDALEMLIPELCKGREDVCSYSWFHADGCFQRLCPSLWRILSDADIYER